MAAAGQQTTGTPQGTDDGRRRRAGVRGVTLVGVLLAASTGCLVRPDILPVAQQRPIDRRLVEYPSGTVLMPLVQGLNCPTAICFDYEHNDLFVAESGADGREPHVFGYHLANGKSFPIYPFDREISFYPTHQVMYGPIGGMVYHHGRLYVSHRDANGLGVITAFGRDGSHATIVADLPAQGDYGVTDLCVSKAGGPARLYFGIGTATNSGVVGEDNVQAGWVRRHPDVADQMFSFAVPTTPIKLYGSRFDTRNPGYGIGQPDIQVTGPFQPFGRSSQSRIYLATVPNGSVCSVGLDDGGDLNVEAVGLHNPRGLAVNQYERLYATNDGMEPRGTRPVLNDPCVLIHVGRRANYMWPDFTTTGRPVTDPAYGPPVSLLTPHGYDALAPLIDAAASGIHPADFNGAIAAVFPSLSGAAKLAFVPSTGPFAKYAGGAVVALDGDRGPYASGGLKLTARVGFKVVLVTDVDGRQVKDFVFNTAGVPASEQDYGTVALERPIDVKFGPAGDLYILDFGQMENDTAVPRYHAGTGAIFKLTPVGK